MRVVCAKGSNLLWPEVTPCTCFQKAERGTTRDHWKMIVCTIVYPAIFAVSIIHGNDTQQSTWKLSHNLHSALGQKACWCFSLASLLHSNTAESTATPARSNLLTSSNLSCYIALTAGKSLVHTPSAVTLVMGLSQHRQSNSEKIQT